MWNISRLAVLLLFFCMTGCGGTSISGVGLFVDIGPGDSFSPQSGSASAGETVTWTNRDGSITHSVTVDTLAGGPDSDTAFASGMAPGDVYTWKVPSVAPGTKYYYHCRFHGTAGNGSSFGTGMVGVIVVK